MTRPSLNQTSLPSTSFVCRRINSSTFLVIEDDSYGEQPHIYVKVYKQHIIITDTGCNSPRQKDKSLTSLRRYLETFPLSINGNESLNPEGKRRYIIIGSHCHYDHILGIPKFLDTDPIIVASGLDKSFILEDFPTHSLCKYVGVLTPQYNVSHWARNLEYFSLTGNITFRIQFLHIPGHTPDSLAVSLDIFSRLCTPTYSFSGMTSMSIICMSVTLFTRGSVRSHSLISQMNPGKFQDYQLHKQP